MSSGPTTLRERALGLDLARGFMLLFIALANSHYFLGGSPVVGGFPQDTTGIDRAMTWAISTFVDGRAYAMFGLLFGYGVAHIVARQTGTIWATRRLLWRRSLMLLAFGAVDAMLFFVGDILGLYGVLLLVGAWVITWSDRWLLIVAGLFFVLCALPSNDSLATSTLGPDASMLSVDLATQLSERIMTATYIAVIGPVGFACPFLVGLWLGRRRVLEQPARHRRLLTTTAIVGIGVAVLGAQPVALMASRVVDRPGEEALSYLGPLHDASGVLGGFGYAALIMLLSVRLAPRAGPVTRAIAATGQRSLTCYLAQSLVWAVVFTPYLLDLSDTLSITATACLAFGAWLVTVLLADQMRAAGNRGPFEALIRRFTYGRAVAPLGPDLVIRGRANG